MSVVDQLSKFRYVLAARELNWPLVRAVDIAKLKNSPPDLSQVKAVTSALSDCLVTEQRVKDMSAVEVCHLISTIQAMLQFALYSQMVLKDQLIVKQNGQTVNAVTAQHVASLEARLEAAKHKIEETQVERQALQTALHNMEKSLVEHRTRVSLLERDLEYERSLRGPTATGAALPLSPPNNDTPQGGAPSERQLRRESRRRHSKRAAETSLDASSSSCADDRGRHQSRFVDWQSMALMLQQQLLTARAPAPNPPPTDATASVVPAAVPCSPLSAAVPSLPPVTQLHVDPSTLKEELKALRSDTSAMLTETLKMTQETVAHVELNLANRLARIQNEQERLALVMREGDVKTMEVVQRIAQRMDAVEEHNGKLEQIIDAIHQRRVSVNASPQALPPLPLPLNVGDVGTTTVGQPLTNLPETPGAVFGQRVVSMDASRCDEPQSDDEAEPQAATTPLMLRPAPEVKCPHCGVRVPKATIRSHSEACDRRAVQCHDCGARTIAMLLPSHKCKVNATIASQSDVLNNSSVVTDGGSANSSTLVRRPSSQLLKDTQDELQRLLEEEAAHQAKKAAERKD